MALIADLINFALHLDQSLAAIINLFGLWTYVILFAVIFAETGFVVTPFFPGDSLIFVSGTFAATGLLSFPLLLATLSLAAIAGDTVNYWIGRFLGPRIFKRADARFFKREYLERTQEFYEKHGGKTIFLARFIPVIRTFAPFVAGIGRMKYGKFIAYNIFGGIVWVALFLFAGYYFGTIPIVQDNLSLAIITIIVVSFIPVIAEYVHHRRKKNLSQKGIKKAVK